MTEPNQREPEVNEGADQSERPYIAYAHQLLRVRERDTAQRSAVRRALRPETDVVAIPYLAKALDSLPPSRRRGAMRAYGMIAAFGRLGHAPCKGADGSWANRRFGARLAAVFGRDEAIGVRLMTLSGLDVETAAEVIAGLLDRLDRHRSTSIDWIDVVTLLASWDPTGDRARQPAFDFYAH